MRRLDLKTILSEAVKCAQTLKTGEVTDTELERIATEFLNGLYAHLPKDLQPKLIAELKANVLPLCDLIKQRHPKAQTSRCT